MRFSFVKTLSTCYLLSSHLISLIFKMHWLILNYVDTTDAVSGEWLSSDFRKSVFILIIRNRHQMVPSLRPQIDANLTELSASNG